MATLTPLQRFIKTLAYISARFLAERFADAFFKINVIWPRIAILRSLYSLFNCLFVCLKTYILIYSYYIITLLYNGDDANIFCAFNPIQVKERYSMFKMLPFHV